jgi:hypothetical protein
MDTFLVEIYTIFECICLDDERGVSEVSEGLWLHFRGFLFLQGGFKYVLAIQDGNGESHILVLVNFLSQLHL